MLYYLVILMFEKNKKKEDSVMKKVIMIILIIIAIMLFYILGINFYVKYNTKDKIVEISDLNEMQFDAIVVLGAKVYDDGRLSLMLQDRLNKTIEVFNNNITNTILVSGDSENNEYDETTAMKNYLVKNGVNEENVEVDIYGLSTYDSIYRMKEVFKYKKVLIITQEYHLYRSLYIADSLGIKTYGVSADGEDYFGQTIREIREILARNKDFIMTKFDIKSKYIN